MRWGGNVCESARMPSASHWLMGRRAHSAPSALPSPAPLTSALLLQLQRLLLLHFLVGGLQALQPVVGIGGHAPHAAHKAAPATAETRCKQQDDDARWSLPMAICRLLLPLFQMQVAALHHISAEPQRARTLPLQHTHTLQPARLTPRLCAGLRQRPDVPHPPSPAVGPGAAAPPPPPSQPGPAGSWSSPTGWREGKAGSSSSAAGATEEAVGRCEQN